MTLHEEIENRRREIRTDGYAMSIGEWISLYEAKEIDIHPEFQRFFRWKPSQKAALIESILLGIPLPPIFVSQRADGVWDVVDGLQRLSTLYEFAGILKDDNANNIAPLQLQRTKYLPSLEGKRWNDPEDPANSLSAEDRLLIKRSKISVSIILRESDDMAKYELFQRLNTGGTSLTQQEVRNCILVMVHRVMYQWLRELASYAPFQECIGLSERPLSEQYDMELALRFIIFATIGVEELVNIGDIGVFLNDKMIAAAQSDSFDYDRWEHVFHGTFDLLSRTSGPDTFRKYDPARQRFVGGFVISPFEVAAYGLGYNIDNLPTDDEILERVQRVWSHQTHTRWSGSGVSATSRIRRLVPLGRELFAG